MRTATRTMRSDYAACDRFFIEPHNRRLIKRKTEEKMIVDFSMHISHIIAKPPNQIYRVHKIERRSLEWTERERERETHEKHCSNKIQIHLFGLDNVYYKMHGNFHFLRAERVGEKERKIVPSAHWYTSYYWYI